MSVPSPLDIGRGPGDHSSSGAPLGRRRSPSPGPGETALSAPDPLEARATRSLVERLAGEGLLDEAARADALETLAARASWWPPLSRLLAVVGTALVLAGVIYFFAANWSGLSRFEKLGLAGLLLAAAFGLALRRGLDSPAGRLALLSATVLAGAFLAVFGQVYQTGADAWQLFATWALLTLPWMLVSRMLAHAITWLVVLELAIATLWMQELHPALRDLPAGLFVLLALLSLGAMALLEWLAFRGEDWCSRDWSRLLLLGAGLAALVLPTCVLIVEPNEVTKTAVPAAALAAAAIVGSWWWHRKARKDLPGLAVTALAMLALLLTGIAKPLFEISDEWPVFILFGLILSGLVAATTVWLRRQQRDLRREL